MNLDDPRLVEYVLGTIEPVDRAAVEAAMQADRSIQRRLTELREICGSPLLDVDAPKPPAAIRHQIMDSVRSDFPLLGYVRRAAAFLDVTDDAAEALLRRLTSLTPDEWNPTGFQGVSRLPIDAGPARGTDCQCVALRMQAGASFPHHGHTGDEWGLVLEGQLRQHDGACFGPGDIVHQPSGSTHAFSATPEHDVLQLVVLNGDLEF